MIDMETEYFRQLELQGWLISTVLIVRTRTNSCCVEMLGKVLFSLLLLLGPCKGEHLSICNREVKPNIFFRTISRWRAHVMHPSHLLWQRWGEMHVFTSQSIFWNWGLLNEESQIHVFWAHFYHHDHHDHNDDHHDHLHEGDLLDAMCCTCWSQLCRLQWVPCYRTRYNCHRQCRVGDILVTIKNLKWIVVPIFHLILLTLKLVALDVLWLEVLFSAQRTRSFCQDFTDTITLSWSR